MNQPPESGPVPQNPMPALRCKLPWWAVGLMAFGLISLPGIALGWFVYYFCAILPEDNFYSIYEARWDSLNAGNYRFNGPQDFSRAERKLVAEIATHTNQEDPKLYYLLAELHKSMGIFHSAVEEYRQVIRISDATWAGRILNRDFVRSAHEELALIYYMYHSPQFAREQLEAIDDLEATQSPELLSAMRDSLDDPQRADFHLLLGKAFSDRLMLDMAAREVSQANHLSQSPQLKLEASNFQKTRLPRKIRDLSPMARYYTLCGEAYENDDRDLIRAAAAYESAVQDTPGYEWGYNDLAKIYRDLKDVNKAESNARKAISLNPDFYNPYLTLGDLALDRRDFPAAIAHFQQTKAIIQRFASKENQHLLANLENQIAYAYESGGHWREAGQHYHLAMLSAAEDDGDSSSDYDYAQDGLTRIKASARHQEVSGKQPFQELSWKR
jgi:tetratricopeptide (TPR) repeat protein